jgi:hypothetical protein
MCFGSSSLSLQILNVIWITLLGAGIKEPKGLRLAFQILDLWASHLHKWCETNIGYMQVGAQ